MIAGSGASHFVKGSEDTSGYFLRRVFAMKESVAIGAIVIPYHTGELKFKKNVFFR